MALDLTRFFLVAALVTTLCISVRAQEETPPADAAAAASAAQDDPVPTDQPAPDAAASEPTAADPAPADAGGKTAADRFDEVFSQWKDVLIKLRDLKLKYRDIAEESEIEDLRRQWDETIQQGRDLVPKLRETAVAAYQESPNADRQLTRFLVKLAEDDVKCDRYDVAAGLTAVMLQNQCEEKSLYDIAGVAAFAMCDFAKADEYLTEAESLGVLSSNGSNYLPNAKEYIEFW